jgi:sugar lactone lactonase YvrE
MSLIGQENSGYGLAKFFYSTNGGVSWSTLPSYTGGAAISSSGSVMAAAHWMGATQISQNSGASWTSYSPPSTYHCDVAVSGDGTRLALADCGLYQQGEYLYTSTNGGSSWTRQTGAGFKVWYDVILSSNGARLAARASNAFFTSLDGGVSVTQRTVGGSNSVGSFATDGTNLYVVGADGRLYASSDWASTWEQRGSVPNGYVLSVSSNGMRMAAISSGKILTSSDGGWTWRTDNCVSNPSVVAVSGDGSRLIAINGTGSIPGTYYAQLNSFS